MVRRVPSKHRNTLVVREQDRSVLVRLGLLLLCGLILAGGFVYAGGRHFAALRLGYETQKLRAELENARAEQRRLILAREAAASPARLERAARQLGMQPMQPAQIDPLRVRVTPVETKAVVGENESTAKIRAKPKPNMQVPDPKKHR